MSGHLLVLYEIADKASTVKTYRAYKEFEKWVSGIIQNYHDAAVERCARIHLFKLKEQFPV